MEAFVAVATAQGDESQLSGGNVESSFSSSCRSASGGSGGGSGGHQHSIPGRPGFSHLLPNSLSRRDLLDNGHYWKYLVGESMSNIMVPQEPATDGGRKSSSPSGTPDPSSLPLNFKRSLENNNKTPVKESRMDDLRGLGLLHVPNSKCEKDPSPDPDGESGAGSDVERFDGKIVYNPDGSAYIIEDSEMSEEEGSLDLPHLEGCIVDGRGVSLNQAAIPQIANAFYVSRNSALYSAIYGGSAGPFARASLKKSPSDIVPDIPIMHSYRVYTVRDNKSGDSLAPEVDSVSLSDDSEKADEEKKRKRQAALAEASSVPIKPILMCFICKLSFGYTKSFVGHAMGDHSLVLTDEEKDVLGQRNVSAIIQAVGKSKEPLVSFLEPLGNRIGGFPGHPVPLSVPSRPPPAAASHQQDSRSVEEKPSPRLSSPDDLLSPRSESQGPTKGHLSVGIDLTRKSPGSGRSSASPGASISPSPTPNSQLSQFPQNQNTPGGPPNFMTGTTIGVCPEHLNGRPSGVDCSKCELILNSSRMGGLGALHTRNSCKTLKCPKCNWHYKYQETLEIHMKEKHPDNETSCIYCIAGQPHPRLARGETYTCGYKPYRCEVCNYSTTTKGNLSIHMQSDKHLNNMQELQNGGVVPNEGLSAPPNTSQPQHQSQPATQTLAQNLGHKNMSPSSQGGNGGTTKPKPTFRCDVCNYETNVARNLRIHMTSEKHTHNMMVLQQNVKHMQHLSALQAQQQFDPTAAALLQFHPSLAGIAAAAQAQAQAQAQGDKPNEAALADMAYNQALLIQMMTGGQMPPHIPPELAPHLDLGLNPDTMEPPPEPPDPNPSHLFQCCVCTTYHTDSLESLSHHLTADRTKLREQEILVLVAGNYMCKLCSYKTNLKANFQLHCKTDKHLQRLQHVNHIKEGGARNEWKLKYLSMSNPIQVRCNACDYYTNSAHKLQLHAAHQRHELSVLIFRHIQSQESCIHEESRIFACALCGFTSRVKLQLLQHTRSLKHLQLEQLHSLQRRAEGKDGSPDLTQVFRVLEQPESESPQGNSNSADVSPSFYNEDGKENKRNKDDGSVLKNALEKDDYDLNCPYCTFSAETESRLEAHVLSAHSGASDLSTSFRTHQSSPHEKHSDGPTMACPLCQETCSDRSKLENHVMQVHSVNSEGLQRLLLLVNQSHWLNSGSSSSSKNKSKDSSISEDADKEKGSSEGEGGEEMGNEVDENRCSTCFRTFRTLDDLCTHQNELGHLEIKQTPIGPGYLCWKKGCNQYFPNAPALQTHFREIHASKKSSMSLPTGMTMAVSEKHVYKYRCNQCSLAFKTLEKLQLHSQYHAIRDASKCCLCGRSFRSLLALQKHVETSHTELSEEELLQFKQSIANNPLLLAGLTGQVLDSATTELLKKESARDEDEDGDEENSLLIHDQHDGGENEDENDSNEMDLDGEQEGMMGKDQQLFEDYLNTQAMAEDSYNDPNRKYKCHRCKVAFTRQSYLTSHNKTLLHRKGEKLSYPMEKYLDPNRPYKCEVCKESFTQKNILLVHYNSVSHLHKLKRAMQEQQQFLPQSQLPNLPTTNMSGGSSGKGSGPSSTSQNATSNSNNSTANSSLISLSSEEDDKKPFKCNICKVAYSQGSTLDIHMRSVLHQTRASKLQELAMTGQIDLSKPLIEQPEPQKLQDQHKKLIQEMLSPKGDSFSMSASTPGRSSTPPSSLNNSTTSPAPFTNANHSGGSSGSSSSSFNCSRCNVACGSQEALLQHQHLYCMFTSSLSLFQPLPSPSSNPNLTSTPNNSINEPPTTPNAEESFTRFNMPSKKSSQMYKHLLESYGFEIVMQFNEYHQKRINNNNTPIAKKLLNGEPMEIDGEPKGEDALGLIPLDETMLKEFPELAKSTCPYCKKEFSSVWILKAHTEEIHKDVVSMEILENFAEAFRQEFSRKNEDSGESKDKDSGDKDAEKTHNNGMSGNARDGHPTAPSTPTASTTPASSVDSVSGSNAQREGQSGSNNISHQLAQHMNDVQAALNAMAASSLGHFNPMMNPMMMAAGLGMGLPMGLNMNMNALAAMNLQPNLVPMMMPPPFDQSAMNALAQAQAQNSPQIYQNQNDMMKQQQQLLQQQQAANSQQKRARTRITDDQLKILRAHFDINNSPSEEQIQQMAQQSGLPPKVIKHWFRNTLFKERQRNKDSPYNFSNPPSTTLNLEEYEKTGEAKVMPLGLEEQKAYDIHSALNNMKKESPSSSISNASSNKAKHNFGLTEQQQQVLENLKFNNLNEYHDEGPFDYHEESEGKSEDERPRKRVSPQGKGKKKSSAKGGNNSGENNPNNLTLSSLINSHLNPNSLMMEAAGLGTSLPTMLPPPKSMGGGSLSGIGGNNFAAPTSTVGGTATSNSLISLASPSSSSNALNLNMSLNINSPGSSGRSEGHTPMTTPPLPNTGGGGSSGNSNQGGSMSSGKRANRTRFTDYQIKVLQEFFENNAYPKDDDLEYLSKLLSLSPRVIVVWFQNARQKARKVYENQPPVDTTEEGAGRFQRTPGLNYQCKKCLLVFQRYYELIRHQKTHCFKEEDAKRSAQAQAAAAQVAAAMSSEDSNSSAVTDNSLLTSSCGPSPSANALGMSGSAANAAALNAVFNAELKAASGALNLNLGGQTGSRQSEREREDETFQCDKCNLVFPRFDLWREHQLVHIMNPNLFPSYSPESPFGILQQHAHTVGQGPHSAQMQNQTQSQKENHNQSHSATSSIAGDATAKRKWSADEQTDDDKDDQPRDKRLRTTILPEQLDYLYQKYQIESNPSRKMLETIAREVGLKKRVVQVWFQNTRARERKGQFRAHAQVINKRCPFCPALFKVKSALETHLAAKHADQYTKGEINIDALPDEELNDSDTGHLSDGSKLYSSGGQQPSSPAMNLNMMAPFLNSLSSHAELESSLKKLYEESLKRYAHEVQNSGGSVNGRLDGQNQEGRHMMKSETGESPLDLSKPVDLSRPLPLGMKSEMLDSMDYMSDGDEYDVIHDSNPNSPASSTASQRRAGGGGGPSANSTGGNKRYRTQMSSLQVKVMKNLFADYKTPTMAECEMLGKEIGLPKRVVQVWFQNARAKEKKSKLAAQKLSGSPGILDEDPRVPEECKLCSFKYSHKYSVQDHIFTHRHIENAKLFIEAGGNAGGGSGTFGTSSPSMLATETEDRDEGEDEELSMNGKDNQAAFLQQLQLLHMANSGGGKEGEELNLLQSLYGIGLGGPSGSLMSAPLVSMSASSGGSSGQPKGQAAPKSRKSPNPKRGKKQPTPKKSAPSRPAAASHQPLPPSSDPFEKRGENEGETRGLSFASLLGEEGLGSNPIGTSLNANFNRTSSPSAGIRSEMEYVVQKIAALARATSFDSTDSNANLRFPE